MSGIGIDRGGQLLWLDRCRWAFPPSGIFKSPIYSGRSAKANFIHARGDLFGVLFNRRSSALTMSYRSGCCRNCPVLPLSQNFLTIPRFALIDFCCERTVYCFPLLSESTCYSPIDEEDWSPARLPTPVRAAWAPDRCCFLVVASISGCKGPLHLGAHTLSSADSEGMLGARLSNTCLENIELSHNPR